MSSQNSGVVVYILLLLAILMFFPSVSGDWVHRIEKEIVVGPGKVITHEFSPYSLVITFKLTVTTNHIIGNERYLQQDDNSDSLPTISSTPLILADIYLMNTWEFSNMKKGKPYTTIYSKLQTTEATYTLSDTSIISQGLILVTSNSNPTESLRVTIQQSQYMPDRMTSGEIASIILSSLIFFLFCLTCLSLTSYGSYYGYRRYVYCEAPTYIGEYPQPMGVVYVQEQPSLRQPSYGYFQQPRYQEQSQKDSEQQYQQQSHPGTQVTATGQRKSSTTNDSV